LRIRPPPEQSTKKGRRERKRGRPFNRTLNWRKGGACRPPDRGIEKEESVPVRKAELGKKKRRGKQEGRSFGPLGKKAF